MSYKGTVKNGVVVLPPEAQLPEGAQVEVTPVTTAPPALSDQQLAQSYEDSDWAAFENHCAAASD